MSCCHHEYEKSANEPSVAEVQGCSKESYCCGSHSGCTSTTKVSTADNFSDSKTACCSGDILIRPCSPSSSILVRPNTVFKEADIEKCQSEVEHHIWGVQGMTCSHCEETFSKALRSIPGISNIKTSFVIGQAEFDVSRSASVDSINVLKTMENMTGFTCTKVIQLGGELDLLVEGPVQEFMEKDDLPLGVTEITVLNESTIRVNYKPRIIGARDLLSHPVFRSPKLAPLAPPPLIASGRAHLRVTCSMALLSTILTIPVLILAWAPLPKHEIIYGAVSLGFATLIQTVVARPFYIGAFKTLIFSQMIEMDLLIVLSTTAAYVYSVIAYAYLVARRPLSTGQFFETSTLLVTLITVGSCISTFARQRAVESISIESLQTPTALLIDPESQQEREIDARLLQYQDIFRVLPDASIVTDGVVIVGETQVDESTVTGEATLVTKIPGMSVIAGSINHSSTITARLTHLPSENTIKTIGTMVGEAKSSKPRIQEIADRFARCFVPIILTVTAVLFVIWVAIGKTVRHQSTSTSCIIAMTYAISALIVSCPCGIGLAVPMVVVIAGGVGARHGLIFKYAETIEIARKVSHVIFDKTGTLTQGKLSVVAEQYTNGMPDAWASLILGLTVNSKHPVSIAVTTYLKTSDIQPLQLEDVKYVVGNGIEATWNGETIRGGNPYWLGFEDSPLVQEVLALSLTMFCVSINGELIAVFGLRDILRLDATKTINQLRNRSIEVSLVSGDTEEAVQSVAELIGIPSSHVRSRCSPGDKQAYVKEKLSQKESVVIFCGDGTNDAIALAQASIGIHMNEGTEIAQSAADVVLLHPSLDGILTLIDLSRAFYRRVVFNFVWSFVYNVFAILLAAGAFPHARIPPQFAGLGEAVSVLPVIVVAMQLRWTRFRRFE